MENVNMSFAAPIVCYIDENVLSDLFSVCSRNRAPSYDYIQLAIKYCLDNKIQLFFNHQLVY